MPENYEHVAGTNFDNILLDCDLIRVTVVGNIHSVKLIMHILLKTASQYFKLHKIIAMPMRHLHYINLTNYFGLLHSQRDYTLLTASDVRECSTGTIAV